MSFECLEYPRMVYTLFEDKMENKSDYDVRQVIDGLDKPGGNAVVTAHIPGP